MSFVYLARPIDQLGESSFLGTLDLAIQKLLVEANVGTFRPDRAYTAAMDNPNHTQYIDELNDVAQWQADAFIALLPRGVASLGVPTEIQKAIQLNKPTVIFTDIAGSVQLAAWERAGATVYWPDDVDSLPSPETLALALTQRPRPNEGKTKVGGWLWSPLLIAGEAANAQQGKYPGDAGIDLATNENVVLAVGEYKLIPTGVRAAIPEGYFGWITGRSSTWSRYQCLVLPGIIDSGYRGELMIGLRNESERRIVFEKGMRLAQLILLPTWGGEILRVDGELPPADRGENGYGSSGH